MLQASAQISTTRNLDNYVIMGELALDSTLRPIKGVLPVAIEARKRGYKSFVMPTKNAQEAAIMNMERIGLSARAYDRILKVARMIADLTDREDNKIEHLAEAI